MRRSAHTGLTAHRAWRPNALLAKSSDQEDRKLFAHDLILTALELENIELLTLGWTMPNR